MEPGPSHAKHRLRVGVAGLNEAGLAGFRLSPPGTIT